MMEDFNDMTAKLDTAIADVAEQLSGKGNCRIFTGVYTGSGKLGSNTHTFPGTPLIVAVSEVGENAQIVGLQVSKRDLSGNIGFTWNGRSVTWTGTAYGAFDYESHHYRVIALIAV